VNPSTKLKLAAFLVLSAVGIVYIASSYLGLVDAVLGRGYTVEARLPASGGLYKGGDVTYRGVTVGKIGAMDVTTRGVTVQLQMRQGVKIPDDSPIHVHNGSAVGEQYLDFEPPNRKGPYAGAGHVFVGTQKSLPIDESKLLLDLNTFVGSVNRHDLRSTVGELGTMFNQTGHPLQRLIDGGDKFVRAARANEPQTIQLFRSGRTVLRTQARQGDNIRMLAHGLANVTGTIAGQDRQVRVTLQGGAAAARQMNSLLKSVQPTLPVMLSNLVTVNQVVTVRLPALEQLLVTYPRLISSGFTGTSEDGYGHVNLQFAGDPQPCRKGYLPPSRWRPGDDLSDGHIYKKAHCASGPPYNMRGNKYAPSYGGSGSANRAAPYDPRTGVVGNGDEGVTIGDQGGEHQIFGEDSWKWMLIGPLQHR
jgi:phospholipid/cholesterol/gamma-HCH transport system substrate-binding protein